MLTDAIGQQSCPVYDYFALPRFQRPGHSQCIAHHLVPEMGPPICATSASDLNGKPCLSFPRRESGFCPRRRETRVEELTSSVDGLFANRSPRSATTRPIHSLGATRRTKGAFVELGVPLISPKEADSGFYKLDLTLADRAEKIEARWQCSIRRNLACFCTPWDDSLLLSLAPMQGFIAPSIHDLFGPAAGNSLRSFTLRRATATPVRGARWALRLLFR